MPKTTKRKQLTKATRFEVMKRDKFTCQYCGQSAPNVILEIDHIVPVSKGGDNNIMNLVTSCRDCNRGKTNKKLDDNSTILVQKKQLDDIQARREQLEMMVKWRQSLEQELDIEVKAVDEFLNIISGHGLSDYGKNEIRKHIRRFGFNEVYTSCEIAINQYFKGDEESWQNAVEKIGGICYNRKMGIKYKVKQRDATTPEERAEMYRTIING